MNLDMELDGGKTQLVNASSDVNVAIQIASLNKQVKRWKTITIWVIVLVLAAFALWCSMFVIHETHSDSSSQSADSNGDSKFGDLIFEENFDTLNFSRWQHEITMSGGGNNEFQYYTNNRSNSYVRDGILYIKPTLTNDTYPYPDFMNSGTMDLWGGNPPEQCTSNMNYGCKRSGADNTLNSVQSARLRTVDSFAFTYGKVQVRAKLPKGDWLWPAIWLLPQQNAYGMWPASGEIDIMESRGNDNLTTPDGQQMGANAMGTTLHWGPDWSANQYLKTTQAYHLPDGALYSADFHIWTLEWTPDGIRCSLDGHEYFTVLTEDGFWSRGEFDSDEPGRHNPWEYGSKNAPFDQKFYLILNVAAGGTNDYFPEGSLSTPDGMSTYGQPWKYDANAYGDFWNSVDQWYPTWHPFENNGEGAAMKVDYIRVYEYLG